MNLDTSLRGTWTIALREVRTYLQDKADLAFSLLLPVATFALIYGAFGGAGVFHGTASVINEDAGGTYSTRLLDDIESGKSLTVELLTRADAEQRLERSAIIITDVSLAIDKADYWKRMYIALTRALSAVRIIDAGDSISRDPILALLCR
jgi:hypothetical protein